MKRIDQDQEKERNERMETGRTKGERETIWWRRKGPDLPVEVAFPSLDNHYILEPCEHAIYKRFQWILFDEICWRSSEKFGEDLVELLKRFEGNRLDDKVRMISQISNDGGQGHEYQEVIWKFDVVSTAISECWSIWSVIYMWTKRRLTHDIFWWHWLRLPI